jgi:hypothetical protein
MLNIFCTKLQKNEISVGLMNHAYEGKIMKDNVYNSEEIGYYSRIIYKNGKCAITSENFNFIEVNNISEIQFGQQTYGEPIVLIEVKTLLNLKN